MGLVGRRDPVARFGESPVGICGRVTLGEGQIEQCATLGQRLDPLGRKQHVQAEHEREHEYAESDERQAPQVTGRQGARSKKRDDHRRSREQRSGSRTQITNGNVLFVKRGARDAICDPRNLLRRPAASIPA